MTESKLKIFSFFSGSGFLDLGFEKNGYEIVFVNEYHAPFMKAYQYSRKKMGIPEPKYGCYIGDVNDFLNERKTAMYKMVQEERCGGNIVGFIGGPPCPDFSIAGKQKGRDGDNGKLSKSYVDLIIAMHPDFFLFENVKGLWRTKRHREFYEELKDELLAAGYVLTDRLTNALEFGAPQDRDRILMVGIQKELIKGLYPSAEVLQLPWKRYLSKSLDQIKAVNWPTQNPYSEDSELDCPEGVPEDMTVEYWFRKNDVYNHPNASDYFTPKAGKAKMETIEEGDDSKKSYKRLHRWRYSPTVAYGNNEVHLHPYKTRRLSAAEALALQTLPKEFELPEDMSLTDKFKTIGNGVPFVMASGVAKTIRDYLLQENQ